MSGAFLPNASQATVADAKVRDYLLDPAHPENNGKAGLFQSFGFSKQQWAVLQAALRHHAIANPVVRTTPNPFGVRYRVECSLVSPDGRNPCIISVWVIDPSSNAPKLVTAF